MKPLKIQKVSDKMDVHSATAVNQSILFLTDSSEEQLNTNVDEEPVSRNLKIKKLNHDCLAQVLMHLPLLERLEMEKVCKKWEEAIQMSSYNFKKINFNDLKITLDKKEETWRMILKKYGRYLKKLTITYEYPWFLNLVKLRCKNIVHFEIDMDVKDKTIPFENFLQTVRSMPKLKYIKVTIDTYNSPRSFSTRLLELLPDDMEQIHLIAIKHFLSNTPDSQLNISAVPDKFKNIRCLTLQGFNLHQSIMDLISLNSNTLVHLDLARCDSSPGVSIFSKLCNLEYLNLDLIKNLSVNIIPEIAHNCHKLNHFEYSKNRIVDNQEIHVVPDHVFRELKYLKNLEYLNFQGVYIPAEDVDSLSCITNNCEKLKHFDVEKGYDFSVSNIKEITKLKYLESLNLQSIYSIDLELLVDIIANNCLELKYFNIPFYCITESAVKKLKNLKKLEKLIISNCQRLTGDLLIDIVDNCKNLINLDLSSCHNVTEASLLQVGKLQNLKRLNIDFIKNVPNAMFDNFNKLEYLSCCDCPSVTDEGIMKLIDNCENLNHLNVYNSGVSVESFIHAAKRKFVFKILHIVADKTIHEKYHSQNDFKSPYLDV